MELNHFEKEQIGMIWFGDRYAQRFTRTLSADEKGVFYDELAKSGLTMHEHHDRKKLYDTCEKCYQIAAGFPQ